MFTATITVEGVDTESMMSLVKLKLKITNTMLNEATSFKVVSTGTALVVESSHTISELNVLLRWLDTPSNDEDNLRDNAAEVRVIVREASKMHRELNSTRTL